MTEATPPSLTDADAPQPSGVPEAAPAKPQRSTGRRRAPRRVSIAATLATSFGVLVLVAVALVYAIVLWSARENTLGLLSDKASLGLSLLEANVQRFLDPVREQVRPVAGLIESGTIDPADEAQILEVFSEAMEAVPQVAAICFVRLEGGAACLSPESRELEFLPAGADALLAELARDAQLQALPFWGAPLVHPRLGGAVLTLRHPVRRDGSYEGLIVATVPIQALGAHLRRHNPVSTATPFILYHEDSVLVDLGDERGPARGPELVPFTPLTGYAGSALSAIWRTDLRLRIPVELAPPTHGHGLEVGGRRYAFVHRQLGGYSDRSWTIGTYFAIEEAGRELGRLTQAAAAGAAVLALALLAAVLLGRWIARPIRNIADRAARVGTLELESVREMPGSVIRELDDQARAFNAMLGGLRWFETYVPKALARRLLAAGGAEQLHSTERELTMMFTDIAGFTAMSESRPASEVQAFLNHHFAILAACIDAEGGTVDKYLGDGMMAFWGAPEKLKDRAEHACRAAICIAEAIRADNIGRARRGEPPVRVRIGIHTGRVTVGNIGAPSRMNYTIVGDAVNTGHRMEQLVKEIVPDAEVACLISGATRADLGPGFAPTPCGAYDVRGRHEAIEVWRLV